ncbi:MAG: NAD(+) synthase [Flavobacteriia bacterium 40-80]|nr:MAG: NAD(+) synthase [Flavobacteriia bacterium 40-80]
MQGEKVILHIVSWLKEYADNARVNGFIIGISGGVDSALVAHLCARTGKDVLLLTMPIRQHNEEHERAIEQIRSLKQKFANVRSEEVDLTAAFESLENTYSKKVTDSLLSMANSRSRLRMVTLYAYGQANGLLVTGTGNKVEDFGIGFYTKYGDGGVDLSPIADLTKTEVFALAKEAGVIETILKAKPTDGLWDKKQTDEDQIGASYPELEWAMDFDGDETGLSGRQKEVLEIYRRLNRQNRHKMIPIPVCVIPDELKK